MQTKPELTVKVKSAPKPGHEIAAQLHTVYATAIDIKAERAEQQRLARLERRKKRGAA